MKAAAASQSNAAVIATKRAVVPRQDLLDKAKSKYPDGTAWKNVKIEYERLRDLGVSQSNQPQEFAELYVLKQFRPKGYIKDEGDDLASKLCVPCN
jgi:hypothetical protein